jgi:RimJ/RimL family protein N-acetyltransferase
MPLSSPGATDSWIDRQQAQLQSEGMCFWAVELKQTGEFIGAAGLLRIAYEAHFTPAVEVGWRIARHFWGKGYVAEAAAVARAIQFGFEHTGVDEIVANTVPANINSHRVMENLDMTTTPADDFEHPLVPLGNPLRQQILYRLTRDQWIKSQVAPNSLHN